MTVPEAEVVRNQGVSKIADYDEFRSVRRLDYAIEIRFLDIQCGIDFSLFDW
jgi:hypothetical protein